MIAGRYDLAREIGRGGMGAVWLGQDTLLGREVALKRIGLMPGADARDLERAEREARLAARLNHPHVVAVYDLVEDGDQTWLVMEYVDGITLSALVQRDGALTPDEAGPLLQQAAAALAAAHAAGIVHRDVKPSNMLVDRVGQVKLTDFGIARAEADATLTRTGLVTGSPAYLAPEVASGQTATEAADVWSLGATLFHLLSGHPPYDVTDNLMGALYRIVHEEPPRLAAAGWLAPVLEHTMTRRPEDRWPMSRVQDHLEAGSVAPAAQAVPPGPTLSSSPPPSPPASPPPLQTADEHATRLIAPAAIDPQPTPVSAVAPVAPTTGTAPRSRLAWIAAAAVVLVLAVVGAAAYLGTRHHGAEATPPASTGSSGSSSPTSSTATQEAAMRAFITTYLATVTSDQHASWAMLTREFQRESGGFGHYQQFWRGYRSATPRNVVADPSSMTVSYSVDYVKSDGSTSTDQVRLGLVANGTSYLIASEG